MHSMPMLRWVTCAALCGLFFALMPSPVSAATLIDSDFSQGDFQKLGWKEDGAWDVTTYPGEKNNPGPVARMPARKPGGTLAKTFDLIQNPPSLSVSMDVGWGWGAPDHQEGGPAGEPGSIVVLVVPDGSQRLRAARPGHQRTVADDLAVENFRRNLPGAGVRGNLVASVRCPLSG